MNGRTASFLFAILLALFFSGVARADDGIPGAPVDEDQTIRVTVRVGESVKVTLTHVASVGTCDDPDKVKVEDGGDSLKLVGLKPGVTHCGFWDAAVQSHHSYVEVTIEPAKK